LYSSRQRKGCASLGMCFVVVPDIVNYLSLHSHEPLISLSALTVTSMSTDRQPLLLLTAAVVSINILLQTHTSIFFS